MACGCGRNKQKNKKLRRIIRKKLQLERVKKIKNREK